MELQYDVVMHKTTTIKRMVEELNPKVLADKIITMWNLSPEADLVDKPQFLIEPIQDEDNNSANDSSEKVIRPKREVQSEAYMLEAQRDHCLEICAASYSVFNAVFFAPEKKTPMYKSVEIERGDPKQPVYTLAYWNTMKTKVYDYFLDTVRSMHNPKYLHFLFGQVEIVRGSRLQKLFFFVPQARQPGREGPATPPTKHGFPTCVPLGRPALR